MGPIDKFVNKVPWSSAGARALEVELEAMIDDPENLLEAAAPMEAAAPAEMEVMEEAPMEAPMEAAAPAETGIAEPTTEEVTAVEPAVPTAAPTPAPDATMTVALTTAPTERGVVKTTAGPSRGLGNITNEFAPLCQKCHYPCDPLRAQIKGKGMTNWICRVCHCRQSQLQKHLGMWPTPEFAALEEDAQVAFFRSIVSGSKSGEGNALSIYKIRAKLVDLLVKKRIDQIEVEVGGQFLPLSVYARQGFDTADIEKNTHKDNIQQHPVLGTVYRVDIKGVKRKAIEMQVREQVLKAVQSQADSAHLKAIQRKAEQLLLPKSSKKAIEDGTAEDGAADEDGDAGGAGEPDRNASGASSSTSHSSSSSSSSSSEAEKTKKKKRRPRRPKILLRRRKIKRGPKKTCRGRRI